MKDNILVLRNKDTVLKNSFENPKYRLEFKITQENYHFLRKAFGNWVRLFQPNLKRHPNVSDKGIKNYGETKQNSHIYKCDKVN